MRTERKQNPFFSYKQSVKEKVVCGREQEKKVIINKLGVRRMED